MGRPGRGWIHVPGADKGDVTLYAISTCLWCKKTKRLLNSLGVAYDYIDVDLLPEPEEEAVNEEVARIKGRAVYPLIVINDTVIPMFNEGQIREALGI